MSLSELNLLILGLLLDRSLRIVHDLRAGLADESPLNSLTKSLRHGVETVLAAIAGLEPIVSLGDSVVINLNVRLRCVDHGRIEFRLSSLQRRPAGSLSGRRANLVGVSSEGKMGLAHLFAVLDSLHLADMNLGKVVLFKLAFSARLVVDRSATKVVMWDPVLRDSVLLGEFLLFAHDANLVHITLRVEEGIILVRGGAVVDDLLEAHAEVGSSHCVRVSHACSLAKLELFGGVGLTSRGLILKFGWPVGLREREV